MRNSMLQKTGLKKNNFEFSNNSPHDSSQYRNRQSSLNGSNLKSYNQDSSKQQELDALWKSFKVEQNTNRAPGVYLFVGFIIGALTVFLASLIFGLDVQPNSTSNGIADINEITKSSVHKSKLIKRPRKKLSDISILPADRIETKSALKRGNKKLADDQSSQVTSENSNNQTYTVKSGDTLESIIVRFYGSYDMEKVKRIQKENNLSNPNMLQLGQTLTIPM